MRNCRYLYLLSVSIDACFRLKRRAVSNEEKDPIMGSGWGYFVEDEGYRSVLAMFGDQKEVCATFSPPPRPLSAASVARGGLQEEDLVRVERLRRLRHGAPADAAWLCHPLPYSNHGFKEGVSLTCDDELNRVTG